MEEDIDPLATVTSGNNFNQVTSRRNSKHSSSLARSRGSVCTSSDLPGNEIRTTSGIELLARSWHLRSNGSSSHGDIGMRDISLNDWAYPAGDLSSLTEVDSSCEEKRESSSEHIVSMSTPSAPIF